MPWFSTLTRQAGEDSSVSPSVASPSQVKTTLDHLDIFRKALKKNKGNIRIAYYGDSIIEGDLITGMLRSEMQAAYGGRGVGMMPITSIVAGFRPTIRHSFSQNWESVSFMTQGKYDIPLGMCGFTFIPRPYYLIEKAIKPVLDTLAVIDTTTVVPDKEAARKVYVSNPAWVKYQAASALGGADSFERIRLFYSHASETSQVIVEHDANGQREYKLQPGNELQVLDISAETPVKSIYLEFDPYDPIRVYGVSFDASTGTYVDSFTIRGYSGMYFERISAQLLKSFQKALDYDLIILHYGENVSHHSVTDYSYYHRGMTTTIAHIREAIPKIPILLISAHGRSIKQNGNYVTSPDIPLLVETQARIAQDTDSAFWNLYEAMGGQDAMVDYVQRGFAQRDYTHFTRSGAEHIGKMLFTLIQDAK